MPKNHDIRHMQLHGYSDASEDAYAEPFIYDHQMDDVNAEPHEEDLVCIRGHNLAPAKWPNGSCGTGASRQVGFVRVATFRIPKAIRPVT